jgi:hypothetical protein
LLPVTVNHAKVAPPIKKAFNGFAHHEQRVLGLDVKPFPSLAVVCVCLMHLTLNFQRESAGRKAEGMDYANLKRAGCLNATQPPARLIADPYFYRG